MDRNFFYIIGKLLNRICLKWLCMTHLDISNTSYGQKKGWESNWWFDFQSLKVSNWLDLLTCRWRATYRWKALDEGYNFFLNLISIQGLHAKLWALKVGPQIAKVVGALTLAKCHLDVGLMERHIVYYKGEGGGFPQVQAVVSLVSSSCSWLVLAPKVLQLCTNHLVLVFCRFVWVVAAY
jgi:hypothetical protein